MNAVGLVAVAATVAGAAVAGAADEPGLSFERLVHEFGSVAQGERVSARFPFVNRSGVDLTISDPIVACDCTAEIEGEREVIAGAAGAVRFSCDTSAMDGAQRRTATVHVSDVERRSIMLTLRGEVELEVRAQPDRLHLGKVVPGSLRRSAIGIRARKSVRLLDAESGGAPLVVRREKGGISLEIADGAALGPFTQEVRLRTSSKRFPVIHVPVSGIVVAEIPPGRW